MNELIPSICLILVALSFKAPGAVWQIVSTQKSSASTALTYPDPNLPSPQATVLPNPPQEACQARPLTFLSLVSVVGAGLVLSSLTYIISANSQTTMDGRYC